MGHVAPHLNIALTNNFETNGRHIIKGVLSHSPRQEAGSVIVNETVLVMSC